MDRNNGNVKKQFVVFGLGNFGVSVALTLQKSGCSVVVVDPDMARVDAIKDSVSYAMRANMADEAVIRSLEVDKMDGVIVATMDNMEASVMTIMLAREQGVPYIMARAKTPLQAAVLKKVGADEVILPEYEVGKQVAQHLLSPGFPGGGGSSSDSGGPDQTRESAD